VLEDDLHAPPELPHALRVQPGDVLPVEDDLSRGGLVQAQQRPTRRGLPRSGLAHQPENLAPAHEKVHAVHGPHRRPLALQHLLQAAPQRKVLDEPAHFEKDVVLLVHANFTSAACPDRKSTRLNSSHVKISYAVFCWKKKKSELIQLGTATNTSIAPAQVLRHP